MTTKKEQETKPDTPPLILDELFTSLQEFQLFYSSFSFSFLFKPFLNLHLACIGYVSLNSKTAKSKRICKGICEVFKSHKMKGMTEVT